MAYRYLREADAPSRYWQVSPLNLIFISIKVVLINPHFHRSSTIERALERVVTDVLVSFDLIPATRSFWHFAAALRSIGGKFFLHGP